MFGPQALKRPSFFADFVTLAKKEPPMDPEITMGGYTYDGCKNDTFFWLSRALLDR